MAPPQRPFSTRPRPLTVEELMDLFASKTPTELAQTQSVHMKAFPFPLWHSEEFTTYTTYSFLALVPLFPGMSLNKLEVEDSFHGPEIPQANWADDATYNTLSDLISGTKGWKELVYRCESDRFLQDSIRRNYVTEDGERYQVVRRRDPQPETWNKTIKDRDRNSSGASVEMWTKQPGKTSVWTKVEGNYDAGPVLGYEDTDDKPHTERPAVEVRVRRGKGVKYRQDGEKPVLDGSPGEQLRRLYDLFENKPWSEIKEKLFIKGAEKNPTSYL